MQPNRPRALPSMLMLTLAGLLLTLFSPFGLPLARAFTNGQAANLVLGQPNFNTAFLVVTAAGMRGPNSVAVDPMTGKVFVIDNLDHRVLRFASAASLTNGAAAEGVFGQANFTSSNANRGLMGPTANTLNSPEGMAVGSDGTLWVADTSNGRVLRFTNAATRTPINGTGDLGAANGVLGQTLFTSSGGTAGQNRMSNPRGVAVDSTGILWVADSGNHRVLRFTGAAGLGYGANADGVLGQANFTSALANRVGGVSPATAANTLDTPYGVAVDSTNILWVADYGSNRVLEYGPLSSNADLSALALSSGTLSSAFTAAITSYSASVANSVQSLTVTPTVSDTNATVKVNNVAARGTAEIRVKTGSKRFRVI